MPVTWLHQLELRNALRRWVHRGEVTAPQRDAALNVFLADLAVGVLIATSVSLPAVTIEAERLGALYSENLGTRSLDNLHLAAALVLGSSEFLTYDQRQASLARAAGMSVPAL